jgi:presenilin-like A22 family membrane protease
LNTIISLSLLYCAIIALFIVADIVAQNNPFSTVGKGLKTRSPRLTLIASVVAAVVTIFLLKKLISIGVPLEYFMAVPFLCILYSFGRRIFHSLKYFSLYSVFFSAGITSLWFFYPNWLVLDAVACLIAVELLSVFGKMTFKQCVILSLVVVVFDVFMVLVTGVMQEVVAGIESTPAVFTIPKYLAGVSATMGLGDAIIPGIVVLMAFNKAREFKAPLLGYMTLVGYAVGFIVVAVVCMFVETQPATLYLLPAVVGTLVATARCYGITFLDLWNDTAHSA